MEPASDRPAAQRRHFDAISRSYDESIPAHIAEHYRAKRVALIRSVIVPGARVLEVGCGTGRLTAALGSFYRVAGVDGSHGMLAYARAAGVPVVQGVAERLPIADEAFDGVVCVAVLHHLGTPESVRAAIREIVRVVRRGGLVILWDHNPLNPYWPLLMRRVPQDTGDERLVPLAELLAAVEESSATVLLARRVGFVPDFVPPGALPLLSRVERRLEAIPLTSWLAAHNVVVAARR